MISAQTITALDNFSSGTLSGGTNWVGGWTGGSVQNSPQLNSLALSHTGNNPQQISRTFTQQPNLLTPFTVSFDLAVSVGAGQGNYGFRYFMENQNQSVFSVAWKNDNNGGALTFSHGNNELITAPGLAWNIATNLAAVQNNTYNFRFDITPQPGQNPGQYIGLYQGTVTRLSDNLSFTTGSRAWNINGNGIGAADFNQIVLFNSSSRTTVNYDNFVIGNPLLIPEPTLPVLLSVSSLALLRRRRA